MKCFTDDELKSFEIETREIGWKDCQFAVVSFFRLKAKDFGDGRNPFSEWADLIEGLKFNPVIPDGGSQ